MFISVCSHLFTSPSAGVARLLRGDLSGEGQTHTGQLGWALHGCVRHHSTLHSLLEICLFRETGDDDVSWAFQTLVVVNKGLTGTGAGNGSTGSGAGNLGRVTSVAVAPSACVTPRSLGTKRK